MARSAPLKVAAVGEAMVEMAPVGEGLYRRGFAGDTFNTAWHMAQCLRGRATVGLVTRVGRDSLSDAFVADLAEDGLDVSGISRDPERTMGLYLIELDGAERSFLYWRENSAARRLAEDGKALAAALDGADLIHLSGITLAILDEASREALFAALATAREGGARICFDPNVRPRLWRSEEEMRRAIGHAISLTDVALPSFDDESATWGDADPSATVERFRAAGVREVAVKNGVGEILCRSGDDEASLTPGPVEGIVDTTGAGDAFNAGYLSARCLGMDLRAAVSAGIALSGCVIRHFGARLPLDVLGREIRPLFEAR